jgi:hypothetical protein
MLIFEKTEEIDYRDLGFGEIFFWKNAYWVAEDVSWYGTGYRSMCIFPLDKRGEVEYPDEDERVIVCKAKKICI